jgi:DNA-directed RNA polymerase specialized sigma24 family protein
MNAPATPTSVLPADPQLDNSVQTPTVHDRLLLCVHRFLKSLTRSGFADTVATRAVEQALDLMLDRLAANRLGERDSPEGLFWTMAVRLARREAHRELQWLPLEADVPDRSTPERRSPDENSLEEVASAVQDLPLQQRQAVVLCLMLGVTHSKAAAEMGISVSTLRHHLDAGRQRLSTVLAPLQARRTHDKEHAPTDHPRA